MFCTVAELLSWTEVLCYKWSLNCLYFESTALDGVELRAGEIEVQASFHSAFLFPAGIPLSSKSYEAIEPRYHGWITVRGSKIIDHEDERILTIGEIIAEDRDDESVHPGRFIRWLKRHLKSSGVIRWGVIGENMKTGDTAQYSDIGYSDGALALMKRGYRWKNHPSYRVVFKPV